MTNPSDFSQVLERPEPKNQARAALVVVHRIEIGQRIELMGINGQWIQCEVIAYMKPHESPVFIEVHPMKRNNPALT